MFIKCLSVGVPYVFIKHLFKCFLKYTYIFQMEEIFKEKRRCTQSALYKTCKPITA